MSRIFFLLLSIVLFSACDASEQEVKHTRSQCIVQVDLKWSQETGEQKEKIVRLLAELIRLQGRSQYGKPPAMAVPGYRKDSIYLQFRNDCSLKYEMANSLLNIAGKSIEGFPNYNVLRKLIQPSPDTIDVEGADWQEET